MNAQAATQFYMQKMADRPVGDRVALVRRFEGVANAGRYLKAFEIADRLFATNPDLSIQAAISMVIQEEGIPAWIATQAVMDAYIPSV